MFNVQIEKEVYFSQEITPFFAQKIQMDESERVASSGPAPSLGGQPKPEGTGLPSHLQAYSRMNADMKKADASIKKMIEKIRNNQQQIGSLRLFAEDPCAFLDNFILEQNGLLNIMKKADMNNLEKQNFKESSLLAELLIDEAPTAENQISYYLKKRTSAEATLKAEPKEQEAEPKIENDRPKF